MLRVESLDAMPLLWKVDDALLALDRLPAFARRLAMDASKRKGGSGGESATDGGGGHRHDADGSDGGSDGGGD